MSGLQKEERYCLGYCKTTCCSYRRGRTRLSKDRGAMISPDAMTAHPLQVLHTHTHWSSDHLEGNADRFWGS